MNPASQSWLRALAVWMLLFTGCGSVRPRPAADADADAVRELVMRGRVVEVSWGYYKTEALLRSGRKIVVDVARRDVERWIELCGAPCEQVRLR